MKPAVVVTGGAGFLGSHAAAAVAAQGAYDAVVSDHLGEGDKWRNLAGVALREMLLPSNLFYWLEMSGDAIEAVVHFAACAASETNADVLADTQWSLPALLWKWCAVNGKRFIYATSAECYGGARDIPATGVITADLTRALRRLSGADVPWRLPAAG